MSFTAIAIVLVYVVMFGTARPGGRGDRCASLAAIDGCTDSDHCVFRDEVLTAESTACAVDTGAASSRGARCTCAGLLTQVVKESVTRRRSQPLADAMTSPQHVYEVRPRKDKRGVDLISDALPFGGLWYLDARPAISYAKFRSRSHHAVIRVYDGTGESMIETHEHAGDLALLRLGAPLMATARLVNAPLCACVITAAGIHAVA